MSLSSFLVAITTTTWSQAQRNEEGCGRSIVGRRNLSHFLSSMAHNLNLMVGQCLDDDGDDSVSLLQGSLTTISLECLETHNNEKQ